MNRELEQLVREAGAPEEVLYELWFVVFVQRFADVLLTAAEEAILAE